MKRRDILLFFCSTPIITCSLKVLAIESKLAVRPEDFGAIGDGMHDDTLALQKAIDSGAGTIIIDKNYLVSPRKIRGVPGVVGNNSVCLDVRSNLKIIGVGALILDKKSKAANGSMLCNITEKEISNFQLSICIDGNNAGERNSFSGLTLINASRCNVTKEAVVKNFTYNGIRLARRSLSCLIDGSSVSNIGYIGIQAQQPRNIIIRNNKINNSGNNAIDLESNKGYQNGHIYNNEIYGCATGIFLESGGNAIIFNNKIKEFKVAGVFLNRINTSANNVKISHNEFKGLLNKTSKGAIAINNNIKNIYISNNKFDDVEYAIWMNGNISNVSIGKNENINVASSFIWIPDKRNDLMNSSIDNYNSNLSTGGHIRILPKGVDLNNYSGVKII